MYRYMTIQIKFQKSSLQFSPLWGAALKWLCDGQNKYNLKMRKKSSQGNW